MNGLSARVLAVHSQPRERIYRALLADPRRDWRVSQLAEQVPDVSVEAVRTTCFLLLGDHLVDMVPHQRHLTLRLNDRGSATLRQITAGWTHSHRAKGGAS